MQNSAWKDWHESISMITNKVSTNEIQIQQQIHEEVQKQLHHTAEQSKPKNGHFNK